MKCITLTQPWSSLVACGAKRIETRSWRTHYRGPLAIHAAKGFPKEARALMAQEPFRSCLWPDADAFFSPQLELPTGVILATCVLSDCREMVDGEDNPFFDDDREFDIQPRGPLTEQERAFGLYEEGRFAWILRNITHLAVPIPAVGALGLWEFPMEESA